MMNRKYSTIAGALVILVALALIIPPVAALPPEQGGCWVIGAGTINLDSPLTFGRFGGSAMTMKAAAVQGKWEHVGFDQATASLARFNGEVHYIVCQKFSTLSGPGTPKAYPNYVNFGGTGTYNDGIETHEGYFFDVTVFDHGEPGIFFDRYTIDIYDLTKKLVFRADGTGYSGTCLDDVKITEDFEWVRDMGCITGGNIDILPPNGGHPY